jgi:hypothetical protein
VQEKGGAGIRGSSEGEEFSLDLGLLTTQLYFLNKLTRRQEPAMGAATRYKLKHVLRARKKIAYNTIVHNSNLIQDLRVSRWPPVHSRADFKILPSAHSRESPLHSF